MPVMYLILIRNGDISASQCTLYHKGMQGALGHILPPVMGSHIICRDTHAVYFMNVKTAAIEFREGRLADHL